MTLTEATAAQADAWRELRKFVGTSAWVVEAVDGTTATLKIVGITPEKQLLIDSERVTS